MPGCADYLTDPIEAPSNWKDAEKIARYVAEKRERQVADAGLDLDLCEVVAIAGQYHDASWCLTRACGVLTEAEMLHAFWDSVREIQRESGVLVGFNCLHFDLPVLLRRSLYLNVETPVLQVDKYRHDGIVDVQHELTFGGRMPWRSLAFYAKRFAVPHDDSVKGEDIAGLVAAGAWDQVTAHVKSDVWTTAQLAYRIRLIQQPLALEATA